MTWVLVMPAKAFRREDQVAKAPVAAKKATRDAGSKSAPKSKKAQAKSAATKSSSRKTAKTSKAAAKATPKAKAGNKTKKPAARASKASATAKNTRVKKGSTGPVSKAARKEPKAKVPKGLLKGLIDDEDELEDDDLESVEDIVADVAQAVDITAVEIETPIEEIEEVIVPAGGFVLSHTEEDDIPAQTATITGATADPVKDYLKQIGKVALLNAELEVELAKRIEAGLFAEEKLAGKRKLAKDTERDLRWVVKDGQKAKSHLLEANLRLVVSLAKRYTGRGMQFLDLIQEGNLGLIRAVEKFDYTKGYKF